MAALEIVGVITLIILAIAIVTIVVFLVVGTIIDNKALRKREKEDARVYMLFLSKINKIPAGVVQARWYNFPFFPTYPKYPWGYIDIDDKRWIFGSMLWYSKAKSSLKDQKFKIEEYVF
jgi:hypothetical protein